MAEPPKVHSAHSQPIEALFEQFGSTVQGLGQGEAEVRREQIGPNALKLHRPRSHWVRLAGQFKNVMILALIAAAALAAALGHGLDAAVIAAVVLANAIIGYVQEGRAESAMAAIGRMLPQDADVLRNGTWQRHSAEGLVPGDIVRVLEGERIPADLKLVESFGLRTDESSLTGESLPVSKHSGRDPEDAPLADRRSMAYSGTLVAAGQAVGLVVATAEDTEIGRISHLLADVESLTTPLIRQLDRFSLQLFLLLGALTAAVIAIGIGLHGMPLSAALLAGVALMVAAVPEGLPPVITITLAIGVKRMARRKAVIRQLPTVETLGSVTAICSDKTGTLTANRLRAEHGLFGSGAARAPVGDLPAAVAARLAVASILCNDAEPDSDHGDPIERALLDLAVLLGEDPRACRDALPRRDLVPFASESRFMATRHSDRSCFKGAPEVVLSSCRHALDVDGHPIPIDAKAWHETLQAEAETGARLLAIADGPADAPLDLGATNDCTLLAVVAFDDPLRPGVREAVAACRSAGITVRMITGDHPATAATVARELGIDASERPLTGRELEELDAAALRERLKRTFVFARTTSADKLRIVEALQAEGDVVAMTGDGANDAPALKRSEVGIAMGIKGTEAAREASGIVLADDNFATLVAGIEEGRGVFDNIRKALLFLLPTSAAESLVILLAVIAGITLPLTPIQVLWVNMATAVTLALSLAFEPPEQDIMHRPPRKPGSSLLDRAMLLRIVAVGLFLTAAVFALFEFTLSLGHGETLARTVALNALVAGEAFYLFNCRRSSSPSWTLKALRANPVAGYCVAILVVMQLTLVHVPPLARVFDLAPLDPWLWGLSLLPGALLFGLIEGAKALRHRSRSPDSSASSR